MLSVGQCRVATAPGSVSLAWREWWVWMLSVGQVECGRYRSRFCIACVARMVGLDVEREASIAVATAPGSVACVARVVGSDVNRGVS